LSWKSEGKPDDAAREVIVKNGGKGSIVSNEGPGIGLDVQHHGKGPAERIIVDGLGVGESVTNTGPGTGKRIVSTGESASETHVKLNRPVKMACGMNITSGAMKDRNERHSLIFTANLDQISYKKGGLIP
jgi:hypothetical protein